VDRCSHRAIPRWRDAYRVFFDTRKLDTHKSLQRTQPTEANTDANTQADVIWIVRGVGAQGRGGRGGGSSRYFAIGPGVSPEVKINGNTISMQEHYLRY